MGILDRLFSSPADRRLAAAEREAWQSAPAPSVSRALASAPWSGSPQSSPNAPRINWYQDQPEPPPRVHTFREGYHDHTFQTWATPSGFEGFDLSRIDNAVAMHRLGYFVETYLLSFAALRFGPLLAALQQAVAPFHALPRHVHKGERGLARLVGAEVEEQLVPRSGLRASPHFPSTLWGTMGINLRMVGFHVLQHTDGDPDPVTRVRPRYTRTWPIWAVRKQRSPMKWLAMTSGGEVEIKNDGKFTLVCDEEEPELTGAIVALGDEAFGGRMSQSARQNWLDFFADPKLVATLPEKVATGSAAGDAFFDALETLYGPEGRTTLPYGSRVDAVAIPGTGAQAFQAALLDRIIHCFMVLTGSAGTIGNGMNTGAGESQPYQPAKGGAWNIRHDLIARPALAMVRGVNQGHVAPFVDFNYAEQVRAATRAGTWVDPVLEIPIMTPEREDRIAGEVARYKALTDQVSAERAAGAVVDQDRVDHLASRYEVRAFVLASQDDAPSAQLDLAPTDLAKVVRVDEARRSRGLPPIGDDRGDLMISELDALADVGTENTIEEPDEATEQQEEEASDAQGATE